MAQATIGIWPQGTTTNYCGVDTAIGMINYDALNSGASMPLPSNYSRDNYTGPVAVVRNDNRKTNPTWTPESISQWSNATPTNTTGGVTNIAADFGTDPRSVAYMSWAYSISNRYYHNYIYR